MRAVVEELLVQLGIEHRKARLHQALAEFALKGHATKQQRLGIRKQVIAEQVIFEPALEKGGLLHH